jgi:hypothetical protein
MPIRKCFFDRNGSVVRMLCPDDKERRDINNNKDADVIFYEPPDSPPVCWVCSLIGAAATHKMSDHGRQHTTALDICPHDCTERPKPTKEQPELWVIHGDGFHREWKLSGKIEVVSPPLAILFVSYGAGDNVFANRTPEVVELTVNVNKQLVTSKIPVFHHRNQIAGQKVQFEELLDRFVVALQDLENHRDGNPLAPFKKVALDSLSSPWPWQVGLLDDPTDLYMLYAVICLDIDAQTKKEWVDTLLESDGLSIARTKSYLSDLSAYLACEHNNLRIPLGCWADLRQWEHDPHTTLPSSNEDRTDAIRNRKLEIVNAWFCKLWEDAEAISFSAEQWNTVKQMAIGDVAKWDSKVK